VLAFRLRFGTTSNWSPETMRLFVAPGPGDQFQGVAKRGGTGFGSVQGCHAQASSSSTLWAWSSLVGFAAARSFARLAVNQILWKYSGGLHRSRARAWSSRPSPASPHCLVQLKIARDAPRLLGLAI
jgi:hypothetical protein